METHFELRLNPTPNAKNGIRTQQLSTTKGNCIAQFIAVLMEAKCL
jgi:hypothetical protein